MVLSLIGFRVMHLESDQPSEWGEAYHLPGIPGVGVFSEERQLNTRNTLALFSAKLIK